MSAQHLTPPHSADAIEASHHTESSEGHQVPGPPHSHGHEGHAPDPTAGKVVALLAFALLLGGAAWIGVRAPAAAPPQGSVEATGGVPGALVLDDGSRVPAEGLGTLFEHEGEWVVRSPEGEVIVPRSRVRWDPTQAPRTTQGGGIVVTTTGQVFVGRVVDQGERGVTVAWPYGEMTIPRERVRFTDPARDTLGEDYWRRFPDAPLEEPWGRPATTPAPAEHEGAARPGAARDRRSAARLAHSQGRWEEAAAAWSRVYAETRLAADLTNLLTCTKKMLDAGYEADRPALGRAQELLVQHRDLPHVRATLAEWYVDGVGYHLTRKQVDDARHWASALEALGPEHAADAASCHRAVAQVEEELEEEAREEHEEHGE